MRLENAAMNNRTNVSIEYPWWFTEAEYRVPEVPSYRGNPMIESLPSILVGDEAIKKLAHYPPFDPDLRQAPSEIRFHLLHDIVDWVEPLPRLVELEQRFSRVIRRGYKARNPMELGYWQQLNTKVETLEKMMFKGTPPFSANAPWAVSGFPIIGISGGGKTTAVKRILSLYPQVVVHNNYGGRKIHLLQLSHMILVCPKDASVKGLCLAFFDYLDRLLTTDYTRQYTANGRASVDQLLVDMARVASIHQIGVLVIDEIQDLSHARSGGRTQMMNFFVNLVNTIGIPVVLVGTYKAISLFSDDFRQARRNIGEGDPIWPNLDEDEIWQVFLESLWNYQYVRTPQPLTAELSHILYEETQGIVDFAVKLFLIAQIRAMASGVEMITPAILRSVAADCLSLAAPALDALRRNDLLALQKYDDIARIDLDPHIGIAVEAIRGHRTSGSRKRERGKNGNGNDSQSATTTNTSQHKARGPINVGVLDPHQTLADGGHTRNADEFLKDTN
jgi:hypothetical protein